MNEEEKKRARKVKLIANEFGKYMQSFKLDQNEKCSLIMNLLCGYLVEYHVDPKAFLKWISKAVPVVVKNYDKMHLGYISGDGEKAKVEIIEKPEKGKGDTNAKDR